MTSRILSRVSNLPSDAELNAKHVLVEHWLVGNRRQTEPLAAKLKVSGKSVEVGPREVGTYLAVRDNPASFRKDPARRIKAMCTFAALNHLKYDSWWVSGDRFSDYVSQ